jgi:hypothetical protein
MNINLDLYKIIHLPNGNILLKLKKDIDDTLYKLVLTDISFYKACTKNIGKINIYEPTNLTHQLLKIIVDEAEKIKSQDDFFDKIKWIQENISIIKSSIEPNEDKEEHINKFKTNILEYNKQIKNKIEHFIKENKINNKKSVIKKQTWIYLFVKIITGLSNHYLCFGEEFFLVKLLYKYFPEIKFDYEQIYIIETYNDIDMCIEQGERYFNLVNSLIKGDKKAFNGKEIEFFPSSYEKNKMSISEEIFYHIQYDIYNDGINWKDYDPIDIE